MFSLQTGSEHVAKTVVCEHTPICLLNVQYAAFTGWGGWHDTLLPML